LHLFLSQNERSSTIRQRKLTNPNLEYLIVFGTALMIGLYVLMFGRCLRNR
jgi:hypothetical protein